MKTPHKHTNTHTRCQYLLQSNCTMKQSIKRVFMCAGKSSFVCADVATSTAATDGRSGIFVSKCRPRDPLRQEPSQTTTTTTDMSYVCHIFSRSCERACSGTKSPAAKWVRNIMLYVCVHTQSTSTPTPLVWGGWHDAGKHERHARQRGKLHIEIGVEVTAKCRAHAISRCR